MERVIFIFVDGCGVGRRDEGNPFFLGACRQLRFWQEGMELADGTPIAAIDANLGLPGAPQSASGQTALFCGADAAAIGHRHRNGYPDRALRAVIRERNLLSRLKEKGARARFLNAYPVFHREFAPAHARIEPDGSLWFSPAFPERFRRMISVTSCMLLASGQKPYGERDIVSGRALYQDYSNLQLIAQGLRLPRFSPGDAARVLRAASRRPGLVLYEYFQTDLYAHRKPMDECVALVRDLDALLDALLGSLDPRQDTLLLTSDHGNLEDLHHRGHNRNPVPLIAWGRHGARLRRRINSLTDVTPALLGLF